MYVCMYVWEDYMHVTDFDWAEFFLHL
jgi:hypothetical protein